MNTPITLGIFCVSKEQNKDILYSENLIQLQQVLQKKYNIQLFFPEDLFLPIEGHSPKARSEQLHRLYQNPKVDMLWALTGGSASNELLEYLDFSLIQQSSKSMIGFSDVSVLLNAITHQTGIINYLSPNIKTLIKGHPGSEESLDMFIKCIRQQYDDIHSFEYVFDANIGKIQNNFLRILKHGTARGKGIGGNLSSVAMGVDTPFFPDLKNAIVLLEECDEFSIGIIRRNLFRLRHAKNFSQISGIIFGHINAHCYKDYNFTIEQTLLDVFGDLNIPILFHAGLGHILPVQTFAIGGDYVIDTKNPVLGQFKIGQH